MGRLPARMSVRAPRQLSLRNLAALLLAVAASTALAACGNSHDVVTRGDNTGAGGVNASYLTVGNLQYQIEVSRQLNPADLEDQAYLSGLPASQQQLGPGQAWFALFVLVLNRSHQPGQSASSFVLHDTQDKAYAPIAAPPGNLYAYRPSLINPGNQLPALQTTAYEGPTQAAVLLYKLPVTAYDNRPLTLKITSPTDPSQSAMVELDV
jgi:hypothetical protein